MKAAQGRPYAEVLGELRKKPMSEDSEIESQTIRQTRLRTVAMLSLKCLHFSHVDCLISRINMELKIK